MNSRSRWTLSIVASTFLAALPACNVGTMGTAGAGPDAGPKAGSNGGMVGGAGMTGDAAGLADAGAGAGAGALADAGGVAVSDAGATVADAGETQPAPASGAGVSDPATALHDHHCGGVDWQRIHGWLVLPHKAPAIAPADKISRCVSRYAGWVTNDADAAGVSRASVYADLAATGQCDQTSGYDGKLVSGAQCVAVHPALTAADCLAHMAASRAFGIATLAKVLGSPAAVKAHKRDAPLMAAYLGHGSVVCGGTNEWKLRAPDGFIARYVAAYNGVKARKSAPPSCARHPILSVALYSGMGTPGKDGVAAANGCWTYERVSKQNSEWKICGYNGSVYHPDGVKWVYDDTNTTHDQTTDKDRILACKSGVPGRGYVDMANRGAGWDKVVTTGVQVHFAELYSSQYKVDDQFSLWVNDGKPGHPMINLGESSTSTTTIHDQVLRECNAGGGWLGVYVYPTSLSGARLSALVHALNACTKAP